MKICVYVNFHICFYLHTILDNRYHDILCFYTVVIVVIQNLYNFISFYSNYKTIFLIAFLRYDKQQYFMTNLLLLNVKHHNSIL